MVEEWNVIFARLPVRQMHKYIVNTFRKYVVNSHMHSSPRVVIRLSAYLLQSDHKVQIYPQDRDVFRPRIIIYTRLPRPDRQRIQTTDYRKLVRPIQALVDSGIAGCLRKGHSLCSVPGAQEDSAAAVAAAGLPA